MHVIINPEDIIKYQRSHPLVRMILDLTEIDKFEKDENIWFRLNDELKDNEILWYPSAGYDITDILHVDKLNFPEFNTATPKVFIHSDLGDYNLIGFHLNNFYQNNQIEIINETSIRSNNININLYNLKIENKVLWLIYFFDSNEKILESFLRYSLQTKFIYSVCDGIKDGMGGYNYDIRIPTKFYSFFYVALKTKFHISKYHIGWDFSVNENLINTINNLIQEVGRQDEFDTNLIEDIEYAYENPIDVYERFENFGKTNELWLRIC
jgi:hypothetical protein